AQDIVIECDGSGNNTAIQEWLDNNGGATATDNCSTNLTWTNNYNGANSDCSTPVEVIFTVTDECGNSTSTSATYSIQDTVAPSITDASDVTVECDGNGNVTELQDWLTANGGATGTDDCSTITWSNNFTALSDECGLTGSATVIFTATDACGNTSETTAVFSIIDTTNPTIDIVANDVTVECDGQGNTQALNDWLASNGGASASDSCSTITWTNNFTVLSEDRKSVS